LFQPNQEPAQSAKEILRYHVTVPNHRALLPKTLQSILRQAVITVEEFAENL
jgi:hypothetical protein